MSISEMKAEKLDLLIDRHIELSELLDRRTKTERRAAPVLLTTMSAGKADAECLVALVDHVLAAYEGGAFDHDISVLSLKAALGRMIADMLDKEIPVP
jgi:hypothetical protein